MATDKPVPVYLAKTGERMGYDLPPSRLRFFPNLTDKKPKAQREATDSVDSDNTEAPPAGDATEKE